MTFDGSAMNDLYLPDRGADRILLLLKMSHVLIDGSASNQCDHCNKEKHEPHRNRLSPI
jgi:hypothetical protein